MLKKIRNYIGEFRAYNKERKQVENAGIIGRRDRLASRIVRFVHSIEKGLSIESPRAEFGYEKIQTLYGWIKDYLLLDNSDRTCVYMAADALAAYCLYHDRIGVNSDKIKTVKNIAYELAQIKVKDGIFDTYGGTKTLKKEELVFDKALIKRLFETRHSIRQFDKKSVSDELIAEAVKMAQSAPSACNRQGVRVYISDAQKFISDYGQNLSGVGGFIENCDKVLVISGKISVYEESEYKQFIVSAAIFAGYLSLALHSLGLGACVVQRSLRADETWVSFCQKNNIPNDEQVVCLIAVGNVKDETLVPYSKRFDVETILKRL